MAKIYFEEEGLERLVNTGLYNCLEKIEKAIQISNTLSVPSGFIYSQNLNSLDEGFKSNFNSIKSVYNVIKGSNKKISEINNELNFDISSIENYSIPLRQSAIK